MLEAHFNPVPHVRAGRIISSSGMANSMIDVSDGVASDLGHICIESGVGAVLEESKIPVTKTFEKYVARFGLDFEYLSLHVGEDYVLLGTARESAADTLGRALAKEGCHFFVIGRIVEGQGIKLVGRDGKARAMDTRGFDHFRKERDGEG